MQPPKSALGLPFFSAILLAHAIRIPKVKKPPGARMNIIIGLITPSCGIRVKPLKPLRTFSPKSTSKFCAPARNVPAPRISLTDAIQQSAIVKPTPIPKPSTAEAITEFLPAKASALPRIMQLTTISGRKTPSAASRAGTNALTII